MRGNSIFLAVSLLALLASVQTVAGAGNKGKIKGMIISRTGETLIVKSSEDEDVTVILDDSTKTQDNKGLFGLEKQQMSDAVLMPGLKVEVSGTTDEQNHIVAKTITVDGDDLETAEMIQAGMHPTAAQVMAMQQNIAANNDDISANQRGIASNQRNIESHQESITTHQEQIQKNIKDIEETTNRFTALSEYDVRHEATVKFGVGSSQISAQDQEQLKELAAAAPQLTGYIIEVVGYADSTGTAAMNQALSEDRAKAVVAYLIQQCGIPVRHVVAPGAMGIYQPAASNETAAGRADNRRAEVKVLVNKGIAGN